MAGKVKHGMRRHPMYQSWCAMKSRCNNPNDKGYKHYGGRGIKICERWLIFENFMADMLPTWKPGLSLDRYPNNDGNYEPGNCRWATDSEQERNKRVRGAIPYKGVYWNKSDNKFMARIKINGKRKYLGLFNSAEEAGKAYEKALGAINE